MSNPLRDIFNLFFPDSCSVCGDSLPEGGKFICTSCRWDIPLTNFCTQVDNPVASKFYGKLPIIQASSFMFFVYSSEFRSVIHKLKYSGGWRIGEQMGEWFGTELAESQLYNDIDIIIPVPLHLRKLLKRGYNQSEYIARGIGKVMDIAVDSRSVVRSVHNPSQTSLHKSERWENVQGIFAVRRPEQLAGKHILLVDDVLTTGATIISCGNAIMDAVPECRISVVTLASPPNISAVHGE